MNENIDINNIIDFLNQFGDDWFIENIKYEYPNWIIQEKQDIKFINVNELFKDKNE
jgi:hypothetical protein